MASITAWAKKVWKDRKTEYPTRRTLTKTDGSQEIVTVARNEGSVSQEGDAFSAENMNDLEERIDAGFTEVNGKLESIIVVSDSIDIEEIKASFSALGKKLASPKYAFQLIRAFHPKSGKCVDFFINADGNLYTTSQITSEFFGIWYINGCYVAK